ncbi:MAG: efflux RND transporter periplasmic adaptor subunit [Bacillota bacterium]
MQGGVIIQKIKQRKKVFIGLGLLLLILLAVFFNLARNRADVLVPVQAAGVEQREIEDVVFATGRVNMVEKQEVYNEEIATVKKIYVRPGDRVTKGQLLISLDGDNAEGELGEARANFELQEANYQKAMARLPIDLQRSRAEVDKAGAVLAQAKSKYERYKNLYDQGAVSAQDFEAAETEFKNKKADLEVARADYISRSGEIQQNEIRSLEAQLNVAKAQYEKAQKKFDRYNVKADADGIVFTVEVSEGDVVASRTKLLTVGNPDRMEIEVFVSEGDSSRVKPGQRAEIAVSALPDEKFEGIVEYISAGAVLKQNEQGGKTLEVPVLININGDVSGMRPGYNADVSIITTEKKKTLTVPYEAVFKKDSNKYVFIIDDKKAKQVEVKTGLNTELHTEIIEGLKEGDRVIVSPEDKIKDGVGVKEVPTLKEASREDSQK